MTTEHLKPWAFQPQERAAALAEGKTTYFTGRPCKHGHLCLRHSANGNCVDCFKLRCKVSLQKKLDKNPNWYKENYAKNPEKYRKRAEKYRKENPEKSRQSYLVSNKKRKPLKNAAEQMRQALKKKAAPFWLSVSELDWIKSYYVAAKQHSETLAVDHIVPLKGKTVCGLHVPWNLCLRTKSDNSRKSNKLTDEAYLPKQVGVLVAHSALPWNLKKETKNVNCN